MNIKNIIVAQFKNILMRLLVTGTRQYQRQSLDGLQRYVEYKFESKIELDNVYVITAGFGSFSQRALRHLAELEHFFKKENIFLVSETSQIFQKYESEFSDFINKYPRARGLWLWKPYILKYYLSDIIPEDSLVIYSDCGNYFNAYGEDILLANLNTTFREGALFFRLPFLNKHWDYSSLPTNKDSKQVAANLFMLKNNFESQNIISDWLKICTKNNFKYLTGKNSSYKFLTEHRFDQAVLTYIVELHSPYEEPWQDRWNLRVVEKQLAMRFPFHALRLSKNDRQDREHLNALK